MRLIDRGGYFVAENAVVLGDVTLAKGASVWYGAVVRGDLAPISIGERTNVQDLCVLHCDPGLDLAIGAEVTIGHHAMVHGRRIGDRALVGINAVILGGAEIGDGSIVGAGAVVRENQIVPPRSLVVGVPARVIGRADDAAWEEALQRAERYLEAALRHARGEIRGA